MNSDLRFQSLLLRNLILALSEHHSKMEIKAHEMMKKANEAQKALLASSKINELHLSFCLANDCLSQTLLVVRLFKISLHTNIQT